VVDLKENVSDEARLMVRLLSTDTLVSISEPLCVASDSGWTAYLPGKWFGTEDMVFFTADVRWNSILLNHTGVGWIVPGRR
jgi:hypothetical protein